MQEILLLVHNHGAGVVDCFQGLLPCLRYVCNGVKLPKTYCLQLFMAAAHTHLYGSHQPVDTHFVAAYLQDQRQRNRNQRFGRHFAALCFYLFTVCMHQK